MAFLLMMPMVVMAQFDQEGRKVKRITFDKEKVNVEYTEGTTVQNVESIVIKKESLVTGLNDVPSVKRTAQRSVYTIDGRTLNGEPRQKGIYILRENKGTKKIIKK